MVQYVVLQGLLFDPKDKSHIKSVNDFFREKGWGQLKYILQFKTLPDSFRPQIMEMPTGEKFGGTGGRNEVVFEWKGNNQEMGRFAVGRFVMGADAPRWLEDYIDNNRPIIPENVLKKLEEMRSW